MENNFLLLMAASVFFAGCQTARQVSNAPSNVASQTASQAASQTVGRVAGPKAGQAAGQVAGQGTAQLVSINDLKDLHFVEVVSPVPQQPVTPAISL